MRKPERTAIEAVAKQFAATWEKGSVASRASLLVAGKRVAVDIARLDRRAAGQSAAAKPRLRFDKVATRLLERLRISLGGIVPDGTTAVLTVTAPIRVAAKTAVALEERMPTLLERRSSRRDEKATIHGNRVQIRLLRSQSARAPKMIGFVHNADSDPLPLFDMTRELLEMMSIVSRRRPAVRTRERWLVVVSAGGSGRLGTYRDIYTQLRMPTGFHKIVMVFADGRVGTLG